MKQWFILLAFLAAMPAVAQKHFYLYHFFTENGGIFWQSDLDSSLTIKKAYPLVRATAAFDKVEVIDSSIYCNVLPAMVNWEALGFRFGKVPPMFNNAQVSALARFDFKPGAARVTFYSIKFSGRVYPMSPANDEETYYNVLVDRRDNFDERFFNASAPIFDAYFLSLLKFPAPASTDW